MRTAAPEIPGPPFACESSVDRLNRHSDGAGFDSLLRTSPAFRRLEVFSREPRRPQDGFRPTHGVALRGLRMLLNAYPHSVVDGDTGESGIRDCDMTSVDLDGLRGGTRDTPRNRRRMRQQARAR